MAQDESAFQSDHPVLNFAKPMQAYIYPNERTPYPFEVKQAKELKEIDT